MTSLKTAELLLRPWSTDDAEDYLALAGDPEVADLAGCRRPESPDEARHIITETLIPRGCLAIVPDGESRAVGNIALLTSAYTDAFQSMSCREAAFSLARRRWGHGIMTEALCALLDRGFGEMNLDYIVCGVFKDNARCFGLLRRLGFIPCFDAASGYLRSDGVEPAETICVLTAQRYGKLSERDG